MEADFDTIGRSLPLSARTAVDADRVSVDPAPSAHVTLPQRELTADALKRTVLDRSWHREDSVLPYPARSQTQRVLTSGPLPRLSTIYARSLADAQAERELEWAREREEQAEASTSGAGVSRVETSLAAISLDAVRTAGKRAGSGIVGSKASGPSTAATASTPTVPVAVPSSALPPSQHPPVSVSLRNAHVRANAPPSPPASAGSGSVSVIHVRDPTAPPSAADTLVADYLSGVWRGHREREAALARAQAHGRACGAQWISGLSALGSEVARRQEARLCARARVSSSVLQRNEDAIGSVVATMAPPGAAATLCVGSHASVYAGNVGVRVEGDPDLLTPTHALHTHAALSSLPSAVQSLGGFTSTGMPLAAPPSADAMAALTARLASHGSVVAAARAYNDMEAWSAIPLRTGNTGAGVTGGVEVHAWDQVGNDKAAFAANARVFAAKAAVGPGDKPPSRANKQRQGHNGVGDATLSLTTTATPASGSAIAPAPPVAALLAATTTTRAASMPTSALALPPAPPALWLLRAQALAQVHLALHRRSANNGTVPVSSAIEGEDMDALTGAAAVTDSEENASALSSALMASAFSLSPLRPLTTAASLSRRVPPAAPSTHDTSTGTVRAPTYAPAAALTQALQSYTAQQPRMGIPSSSSSLRSLPTGRAPPAGTTSTAFAAARAAMRRREAEEERLRRENDPEALPTGETPRYGEAHTHFSPAEEETADAPWVPAPVLSTSADNAQTQAQVQALLSSVVAAPAGTLQAQALCGACGGASNGGGATAPSFATQRVESGGHGSVQVCVCGVGASKSLFVPLAASSKTYVLDRAPVTAAATSAAPSKGVTTGKLARPGQAPPRTTNTQRSGATGPASRVGSGAPGGSGTVVGASDPSIGWSSVSLGDPLRPVLVAPAAPHHAQHAHVPILAHTRTISSATPGDAGKGKSKGSTGGVGGSRDTPSGACSSNGVLVGTREYVAVGTGAQRTTVTALRVADGGAAALATVANAAQQATRAEMGKDAALLRASMARARVRVGVRGVEEAVCAPALAVGAVNRNEWNESMQVVVAAPVQNSKQAGRKKKTSSQ